MVLDTIFTVLKYILTAITILTLYKFVYMVIGLFWKARKFAETDKRHKFAVVISARNEEKVIGNLLDSIHAQNYPKELITVFVIADNCDDGTAEICRKKGAIVFERHDPKHARKGWALQYGFEKILCEYGADFADGFFIFDADNLLHPDYMLEMNKAFSTEEFDVICGYRNTKNFATNLISSGYGIHFYRSSFSYHRPRQVVHSSTHIAGTGYLVKSKWLAEGWHWTCLTEDTQFTYEVVSRGGKIGYCEDAEFYDEQPTRFKTVLKQRIRWAKGRLYAFFAYGYKLVAGIFRKKTNKWACYDMIFYGFPYGLCSGLLAIATFLASFIGVAAASGWQGVVEEYVTLSMLKSLGTALGLYWLQGVLTAFFVVLRERKKIHCPKPKLVFYVLFFPWFDLVDVPLSIASLFMHVTWRKIEHDDTTKVQDIVGEIPTSKIGSEENFPSEGLPSEICVTDVGTEQEDAQGAESEEGKGLK